MNTKNTKRTQEETKVALYAVAKRAAHSTTKALCGLSPMHTKQGQIRYIDAPQIMHDLRREMFSDSHNVEGIATCTDMQAHERLSEGIGEGLDIVHVAYIATLEQYQKAVERGTDITSETWIDEKFETNVLNRVIVVKGCIDESKAYKTITTTAWKEVCKAIRLYVENSRAVQTATDKYSYIESFVFDDDGETVDRMYYRQKAYTSMSDENGRISDSDYDTYNAIIEGLNLTDLQAETLNYRLSGYGYKAIARKMGVSVSTIKSCMQSIQKKCEKIGFTPTACGCADKID